MKISVLILAGSRYGENEPLAQLGQVSHKAILPVGGIPMIEHVVTILEKTPQIGKIWVCIENSEAISFLGERVEIIKALPTPSESVFESLKKIKTPCLITTADHALLKTEWVEEFLEKSLNKVESSQIDLTVGIAYKNIIERDVPHTKRTYIPLADHKFSGCNLFYLHNENVFSVIELWNKLQNNRKHPLKMAKSLGFWTLFLALIRRLTLSSLKKRIFTLTKAKVDFVPLSSGFAALDVDKISDFYLVEKILREQKE